MLTKIVKFLVGVLVFILIIDPSDLIFRLKIPIFLLIYLTWFTSKIIDSKRIVINRELSLIVSLFLLIPLISLLSGIIQDNISDYDFSFGVIKSFLIVSLLFIIYDLGIPIINYVNKMSLIIIAITISVYLLVLINADLFRSIVVYLVDDKQVGIFALREYFGMPITMIYYKTCPILVFPLSYYLYKFFRNKGFKHFLIALLCLITLFLSGTRANILAAFLVLMFFIFNNLLEKKHYKLFLFISTIAFIGVIISVRFSRKRRRRRYFIRYKSWTL